MARVRRLEVGAMVYHALNRANFRSALFQERVALSGFSRRREGKLKSRADAPSGLLPDAESLAFGALSARGR